MIIVLKKDNGYLIAKDKRIIHENCKVDSNEESNDLLFRDFDETETIIGVDHSLREAYLLKYLHGLLPNKNKKLTMEFMVRDFMPKLYNEFVKIHYAKHDHAPKFETDYVIVRHDKAFAIHEAGFVVEIGKEYVIGDNLFSGVGILKGLPKDMDPLKKIMIAFDYANKTTPNISSDIIVYDTSSKGEPTYKEYKKVDIQNMMNNH